LKTEDDSIVGSIRVQHAPYGLKAPESSFPSLSLSHTRMFSLGKSSGNWCRGWV